MRTSEKDSSHVTHVAGVVTRFSFWLKWKVVISMVQSPLLPRSASELSTLKKAVNQYHSAIFLADEYLTARGISPEVRSTSLVGVVEDPAPGHEPYVGMLSIPYLGARNQPLTVRFRCIAHEGKCEGHPKYRTLPHDRARMFNVKAIHEAEESGCDEISICEGELDALILDQLGHYAVALPGANQWRRHHAKMLAGFERVLVWGDPDEAGDTFVGDVLAGLPMAQKVHLSGGDVNETFLRGGAEAIERARKRLIWA